MSSVDFLVKLRDAAQMIADAANEQLEKMAPTDTKEVVAVKEETFAILKFEPQRGERLGKFEVAYKPNNLPDKWSHAYNILRQNNATIKDRYHGPNYVYSYWLYKEDQIYRQKLKGSETKSAPAAAPSNIFPKDLADMLIFEDTVNWTIVKPRQYLGSEAFAKLASIVKDHGGDYISAGKESHFRLPKTAAK